jgi:GntR family transcriptional regulator of arabinose operon
MKKYEKVMAWIREQIEDGRIAPGDRLPSESELMRQLEVSRNSVRKAIGELAKLGLVVTEHGIGTFCRTRTAGQSVLVGLVCFRISSYIFPRIIQGCNRVMQKNGYRLVINESWYDLAEERSVLRSLQEMNVAGIIVIPVQGPSAASNADLVKDIEDQGIAVVLLDNEYPKFDFSSVVLDDEQAGHAIVEHLWNAGHREIGMLYSFNYRPKIRRREGVLSFLTAHGASIRDEWNIGIDGQTSPKGTYRQIREFFRRQIALPTAMICSSDDEALMFIRLARRHGIQVPKDISVVSFDNSDLSKLSQPRLTSMNHPSEYMGEIAATILIDKIQRRDRGVRTRTVIHSELIRRDSVSRPSLQRSLLPDHTAERS